MAYRVSLCGPAENDAYAAFERIRAAGYGKVVYSREMHAKTNTLQRKMNSLGAT